MRWGIMSLTCLGALLTGAAAHAQERYVVELRDFEAGRAALMGGGATIVRELRPQSAVAALIPDAALEGLSRHPQVALIEPDHRRYPLSQTTPYGIPMVQADQVWTTATGAGRKVCVIDSGFSVGHEDLQTSGVTGYPSGWDRDRCGHGTHVAGTIAALENTAGVVGVLPGGVSLHIVKVFGDDCSWTYSSDLIDAANRCRDAGANVISMSLGGSFASRTEQRAFNDLYNQGLLSIAAAGNGGNTRYSYPASYDSVISVGALDSNKVIAGFSQRNDQVELAAPGVSVLSTVPWNDENTITVDGVVRRGTHIQFSARTEGVSGALVDGGLCDATGSWSGKVVLCERGSISFNDKVQNVQTGGGVAAVIYNNVSGGFSGTLGNGNSSSIPAIGLSQEDGKALVAEALGRTGTVRSVYENPGSGYEAWNGTSMATPHVSGIAALIWSVNTAWTNAEIREALQKSAEDLGAAGRDDAYGYGLVQAKAALDLLQGTTTNPPPEASFLVSCSDLTCSFTDTSTDNGTVVSWAWDFGGTGTSSVQNPNHTFPSTGTYRVQLTILDDGGASDSAFQDVTVGSTSTEPTGIVLSVTPWKYRGLQRVDLAWDGATTTHVDVYRDGVLLLTTENDKAHTDVIDQRGGGSYTYRVCEASSQVCSEPATATF